MDSVEQQWLDIYPNRLEVLDQEKRAIEAAQCLAQAFVKEVAEADPKRGNDA